MDKLEREFLILISTRIEHLKEEISAGMITTFEDYKSKTGQIQGLVMAKDIMEEARSNVAKER